MSRLASNESSVPDLGSSVEASADTRRKFAGARRALDALARTLRRVIGAPDYERYLAHVREHHPDRVPLTREKFDRERLSAKYERPGSRCC